MMYQYSQEEPETDSTDGLESVSAELVGRRRLYEDPYFPASSRSLNRRGDYAPGIIWKRPHEIVRDPVFIDEGATQYDIGQGELGDCWVMAAAASMAATNKNLLMRVIASTRQGFDRSMYTGRFIFRFWQNDKWVDIVIDDRLPTSRGHLIYGHNRKNPNEFWCALLEKAYAKLYGSYEGINGGRPHHALVDMTGGIAELVDLKEKHDPKKLFELLKRTHQMNTVMGGAIFGSRGSTRETKRPNGLYEGHAYSITAIVEVTDKYGSKHRLLRIRNPWGQGEWNGPWSDSSSWWESLSTNDKTKLRVKDQEGEFWMAFEDVVLEFSSIELTHLTPDSLTDEVAIDMEKKKWDTSMHKDEWIRGVSAGGCGNDPYQALKWKNPQFRLSLEPGSGDSTVVVSLSKVLTELEFTISIGFFIYQLRSGVREEPLGEDYERNALLLKDVTRPFASDREVTKRFVLQPGQYVIIPTTFNPHEESKFVLRIFAEKKAHTRFLDWRLWSAPINKPDGEDTVESVFRRVSGNYKLADPEDLRDMLCELKQKVWDTSDGFSMETSRSLLAANDTSRGGVIDLGTVEKIWKDVSEWQQAFQAVADKHEIHKDWVDTYELRDIYKAIGIQASSTTLRSIARRFGGRSGKIYFEDLVMSAARLQALERTFQKLSQRTPEQTATLTLDEWMETAIYQ